MTQQVNLYQPSFEEARTALDPSLMLRALAALVAGLALASIWLVLSAGSGRRAAVALEEKVEGTKLVVNELEARVAAHQDAAALDAELAALRAQFESKQRLGELLSERVAGTEQRFSAALRGLARHRIEGLWLTGFELSEGGRVVSVRGSTLRSDLIPRYLQRLGRDASFAGKEFHTFNVRRGESSPAVLDFEISTRGEQSP